MLCSRRILGVLSKLAKAIDSGRVKCKNGSVVRDAPVYLPSIQCPDRPDRSVNSYRETLLGALKKRFGQRWVKL